MTKPVEKIEIRQAGAEDAELIAVLCAVTFYEAYFEQDAPRDLARYIVESFAPDKVLREILQPAATFFILSAGESALGYAKLRADSKADCVGDENAVELQRIYLVERAFGKGFGEKLLAHCLDAARRKGFSTLWLGVWEENRRALRFYEKHGFRAVGEISYPYGDAVGRNLVMERRL